MRRFYKQAMKADQWIYDYMYKRIPGKIRDKEVLEIATEPGLLAKHVTPAAKSMAAADYSDGMIEQARKKGLSRQTSALRLRMR